MSLGLGLLGALTLALGLVRATDGDDIAAAYWMLVGAASLRASTRIVDVRSTP